MSETQAREAMEFDVVVVGAGPSGLACAIRLKQLAPERGVCVVEKGGEVGAHILSGAVIETRALDELLPDWRETGAPLHTHAKADRFLYLTATTARALPTPPQMHNEGNFIVSLGDVCRWLATRAEALGVEIYPGFAAAELLEQDGLVVGIATGDMGIARDGQPGPNHTRGMELRARFTVLAEGCRGSLTKQASARFGLREGRPPQTYGLGIKELWEIPAARSTSRAWSSTASAGRSTARPMAGAGCITGARTWSATASWSGSTTPTHGCRRSTRCSA